MNLKLYRLEFLCSSGRLRPEVACWVLVAPDGERVASLMRRMQAVERHRSLTDFFQFAISLDY